jgi:MFS family permease
MSGDNNSKRNYNLFLLVIAGLGGLLYGMDYGIVASALPYLKDTFSGTPAELSIIVAAMMLGGVFSTLFAGLLADWLGRKRLMNVCGVIFVAAIPLIAL